MMAVPKIDLMTAFERLQDKVFDGGWETHSVWLLNNLVHGFGSRDAKVLALPQAAFHSGS